MSKVDISKIKVGDKIQGTLGVWRKVESIIETCFNCDISQIAKKHVTAHKPASPQSSPVEFEAGEKFAPEQGDDIEVSLNGKDWMATPYEFLALNANGDYICWTDNKIVTERWPYAREIQPAEVRPDYLEEGEELWEVSCITVNQYESPDRGAVLINPEATNRFIGFAVEDGDGKVKVMNSPHWFSKKGYVLSVFRIEGYTKAKCRGAVMLKESK